ncbi:MAG: hypothetical protein KJP00_02145 [Bacteroidia bacterium]|nr:hypothetical protein [Bacteroidia bacterium]
MKLAKKILIGIIALILLLFIAGVVFIKSKNQPLPVGSNPEVADQLANDMLVALDKPGFDSTHYIKWDFAGRNQYVWDKVKNYAEITMGYDIVLLNLNEITGKAYNRGIEIVGPAKDELIQKAWTNWCNDSFWLIAPYKVFDPGTNRSIVDLEDGKKGLLVSYASGGVTPGDSYLWILNSNNVPGQWKMWVSNIPWGGAVSTWEDWITLYSGAKIATKHNLGIIQVIISDLMAGEDLSAIGLDTNIFDPL